MLKHEKKRTLGQRLVGCTRFMSTIPVIGLFIAAVVMAIVTLGQAIAVTIDIVVGEIGMQDMLVEYIECADYFLLAIVLYIMSIGLYSLFIDDRVKLPGWLEIHTLDDLKEKLVSVIVVVMGVFFLGRLIHGADAHELLYMGAGIGAVVLSLAYFVRHIMVEHGGHNDHDEYIEYESQDADDPHGEQNAQDAGSDLQGKSGEPSEEAGKAE